MTHHKSREERLIEQKYREVLKKLENTIGSKVTFSNDLQSLGIRYFGLKFKGVYPSDKIPKLNNLQPYAIINLDNSSLPGSHWVAVAYDNKSGNIFVYDSFGRKTKKILPDIYIGGNKIIDSDHDPEQRLNEDNCGQRSLAWLIVFDEQGDKARLI